MSEYLILFDLHERNRKRFEENYSALVEEFNNRFIAISDQRVIDSDYELERFTKRIEALLPLERVSARYVSRDKIQLIL